MKFAHSGKYLSGIVVPLSALRSAEAPASGEFPDLARLGELASAWKIDLVQLLPVNDSGFQSSPYSALSAFALHPLYLCISELPEAKLAAAASYLAQSAALAEAHAGDERLPYGPYLDAKLSILEGLFGSVYAAESGVDSVRGFAAWLEANAWVKAYAVFVELKRMNAGKPWWEWRSYRDPKPADIEALWSGDGVATSGFAAIYAGTTGKSTAQRRARAKGVEEAASLADSTAAAATKAVDLAALAEFRKKTRFRAWLQWRAEEQFVKAAKSLAKRKIALMGDLPILLNEDSAEVWSRRGIFKLGLAAGAPPDMYAEMGQNWGFPIYDWDEAEKDDFAFWKERLASAEKFYSSYRIDHVLGFFRIWALGEREHSGYLGRFVPDEFMSKAELQDLGFSPERVRWLSEPHIPTERLIEGAGDAAAAAEAREAALDRIGNEELFLFKRSIKGERDIEALADRGVGGWGAAGIPDRARFYLLAAWRDRVLFEFEPGRYTPAWRWRDASAWSSLTEGERSALERLAQKKRVAGEKTWEENGRKLLGFLKKASSMLPCAEDLGAVPDCVPKVLEDLGILGLRVVRWTREWEKPESPYVPLAEYPRLTVACPSVHDSSSLRGWWETEAEKPLVWKLVKEALGRDPGSLPDKLDPAQTALLLEALARSNSTIVVYPLQDLLAMSQGIRPKDSAEERINVPGTVTDWNWAWRLPTSIETIASDEELAARVVGLSEARPAGKA